MSDIIEEFMEEDTQKGMYMTFKSGKEHFGVAVKFVNEIIGIQKITAIPEAEEYIKGLINLRGKIIPVLLHFRSSLLCKCERQDLRRIATLFKDVCYPARKHPGLA